MPILRLASIILLILTSYILFNLSSAIDWKEPHNLNLILAILSAFDVAIFFSWIGFGEFMGISVMVLSCVVTLLGLFRLGLEKQNIFIISFFAASGLGYIFLKIRARLKQVYILKREKTEEKINILANVIKTKNKSIKSFEEKLKRYSVLKEVVEHLSITVFLDAVNGLIVEKTLKTLGKPGRVLLFLVNQDKQELVLSASKGEPRATAKKGDVFDQWVLRNRISLIIEDVGKDFRFTAEDVGKIKPVLRSLISTPLMSENKVTGILRMDSLGESNFTQDDLRLLAFISDLGAVAIQNAFLYSRTQELAIRDGLTGLYLRRYFMQRLKEEIKRSSAKKRPFSILLMDIDHFKDYNDKFGHISGDIVLRRLTNSIASMIQEGDLMARYGGEEFMVLLFGADSGSAAKEAEAIRRKIEGEAIILRRQSVHITASIGVSSYPEDGLSEEELIKIADERLYKAKAMGRNRVCANS